MYDFEYGVIEVRYASSSWGPFVFDFSAAVPSGTSISSVVIRSFLGKVSPGDDLSLFQETTQYLIDSVKSIPISSTKVALYFNYPGAQREGDHTVVFEVTLNNGAVHPFYFYKVKVH